MSIDDSNTSAYESTTGSKHLLYHDTICSIIAKISGTTQADQIESTYAAINVIMEHHQNYI